MSLPRAPLNSDTIRGAVEFLRSHGDGDEELAATADMLEDIANGLWTLVSQNRLTPEQVERIWDLRRTGKLSLWTIPDGSWLASRRNDTGLWVEVIDPEASCLLAFDFAPDDSVRSSPAEPPDGR